METIVIILAFLNVCSACSAVHAPRRILLQAPAASNSDCGKLGGPCCSPDQAGSNSKPWLCSDGSTCIYYQLGGKFPVDNAVQVFLFCWVGGGVRQQQRQDRGTACPMLQTPTSTPCISCGHKRLLEAARPVAETQLCPHHPHTLPLPLLCHHRLCPAVNRQQKAQQVLKHQQKLRHWRWRPLLPHELRTWYHVQPSPGFSWLSPWYDV